MPATSTIGPSRARPAGAFADVLPYFKRMESAVGGEEGWRGTDGPMHVQRGQAPQPALRRPSSRPAARPASRPTEDYNGSKQEGFGAMEQTIHHGRRWSAANAYLRPALKRQNVSLVNGFARRVVIENQRATGVEIEARKQIQVVKARREVIVAASSINSPKLLMLSGIGPAEHLAEHGIEVVADRPGVGQNLQDHMELYIQQESTEADHALFEAQPVLEGADRRRMAVLQDRARRHQPFRGGRLRALRSPASTIPTSSITSSRSPSAMTARRRRSRMASRRMSGRCARSRAARSRCASPDPKAKPVIRFNYMSHPDDWTRVPPLHPADPRDLRPEGLRSLSRPRDLAGRRCRRATTSSTPSSATMPRAPTIPAAPAAWAAPTIR